MLSSLLSHPKSASVELLNNIQQQLNSVVLGKPDIVKLCLCSTLARGHLLIEDYPGVGKTTLAQAMATVLGLEFNRIQFTSDMLPADVVGVSIYDAAEKIFEFNPGPIFSSVVLADEINRATPKAQSALLEAMEERQVSVDGVSHELPEPFFVIATQNPHDQSGTFALPESQLDRFMMTVSIGYPGAEFELALLRSGDRRQMLKELKPSTNAQGVIKLQELASQIHISKSLSQYVLNLLTASREAPWLDTGLSPRAGLALISAARAWALLSGRDAAIPEDIQAVAGAVVGHRLVHNSSGDLRADVTNKLIESVQVD